MANQQLMAVFSLLLLLCLASNSVAQNEEYVSKEQRNITVAVEGMVYCQSCAHRGTSSLTDAKPIPSARVLIKCTDYNIRVNYHKVATTGTYGYFYHILGGLTMPRFLFDRPLHGCTVHPVSSPLSNCNLTTNINNGLYGAPLHYERSSFNKYPDNIHHAIWTAAPIAFSPAVC